VKRTQDGLSFRQARPEDFTHWAQRYSHTFDPQEEWELAAPLPAALSASARQHVRLGNEPWLDKAEHDFFQRPCAWLRQTRRDIKKTKDDPDAVACLIKEWGDDSCTPQTYTTSELYRWCRKWWDGQTDAVLEERERKAGRAFKVLRSSRAALDSEPKWLPAFIEALTGGEWSTYEFRFESGLSGHETARRLNVSQTLIQKRTPKIAAKLRDVLEANAPGSHPLQVMETVEIEELMGAVAAKGSERGAAWCRPRQAPPRTPCWSGRTALSMTLRFPKECSPHYQG
jgi:hypothetical protein